jgi:hypothetical protein
VSLCKVAEDRRVSLGIRLLSDLRILFGDAVAIHTDTLLHRLADGTTHGLDADAPWGDLHGKPLGQRGLASMLKQYGVSPTKVTVGGRSLQGYRRDHLWDAWARYLPCLGIEKAEHPEFSELASPNGAASIPEVPVVPQFQRPESAANSAADCARCRNFKPDTLENGCGTCLHFNCATWPAPNPGCRGYTAKGAA